MVASAGLLLSTTYLWSVLLLYSRDPLPWRSFVVEGSIGCGGFLVSAALYLMGQRVFASTSESTSAGNSRARILGPWRALPPLMVAGLVWPTVYFTAPLDWLLFALLIVYMACFVWVYATSAAVAADLCAVHGWTRYRRVQNKVIILGFLALLAPLPLFSIALSVLHALGHRVYWP
jgi:hypothetical protein